jgi:GrpB-like predicted nucleotidyltransferase (UPF0157 family)
VSEPNIVLREYDPAWPRLFEALRERLLGVLGGLAVAVEHVGSTAVPGLAAKPVVDIDAVVPSAEDVPLAIERLERAGWRHEGDFGIPGREAFEPPADTPWHHLYVLAAGAEELRRHIAFRDYLRAHPEAARTYVALKRESARRFGGDRRAYTDSKGEFVEHILSRSPATRFSEGGRLSR